MTASWARRQPAPGGKVTDAAYGPGSSCGVPLTGAVFPYEVTTNSH